MVVSNHGSTTANDVTITDFIPAGFTSKDAIDDTITVDVETINPGNEFTYSYSVKAIGELTSTEEIPINFPRATVTYSGSQEFNVQSNKILATAQPSEEWGEIHTVEAIAILLFVAFAFGAFGSTINWLNADNETKELERKLKEKEEATENQVSELRAELERESKEKEEIEKKFKLTYSHLEAVKKTLKNLGGEPNG